MDIFLQVLQNYQNHLKQKVSDDFSVCVLNLLFKVNTMLSFVLSQSESEHKTCESEHMHFFQRVTWL